MIFQPELRTDDFDGAGQITREDGRVGRSLFERLQGLSDSAIHVGRFTSPVGDTKRPVTLAEWQAAFPTGAITALPLAGTATIWNLTENRPQWWNGTAWVNALGVLD